MKGNLNSFFRRMEWAPDGSFFLAPGGEFKKEGVTIYCAYAFSRNKMDIPSIAFPMEEPVIITSFC